MNTGTKQATIAYKTTPNGQPIDVDGVLTSISGKRQAIALLTGYINPNPLLYEIEIYFTAGGMIGGQPTTEVDLDYCPVSVFTLDKNHIVLHPGNVSEVVNIFASFGWVFLPPFDFATITPISGGAISTPVTIARTATLGQGYAQFRDNATSEIKTIYIINTDALGWILTTGFWNNLRFWEAGGVWNY